MGEAQPPRVPDELAIRCPRACKTRFEGRASWWQSERGEGTRSQLVPLQDEERPTFAAVGVGSEEGGLSSMQLGGVVGPKVARMKGSP